MAGIITVPENASTPSTPATGYWSAYAKSDGLYILDDAGTETGPLGTGGGGGTVNPGVNAGRLSLSSSDPNPAADVTAATSVYYMQCGLGNQVALYDGSSAWALFSIPDTPVSASLSGLTANTNYDVFLYSSGGTLTLDLVAWTDDTTRATALANQDGVKVKTGATARRFIGTLRITGTTGQCERSGQFVGLCNWDNRQMYIAAWYDATVSWTYNSSTTRQMRGTAANLTALVLCDGAYIAKAYQQLQEQAGSTSVTPSIAIAVDGATGADVPSPESSFYSFNGTTGIVTARTTYEGNPGAGYHTLVPVENSAGGTTTFYASSNHTFKVEVWL